MNLLFSRWYSSKWQPFEMNTRNTLVTGVQRGRQGGSGPLGIGSRHKTPWNCSTENISSTFSSQERNTQGGGSPFISLVSNIQQSSQLKNRMVNLFAALISTEHWKLKHKHNEKMHDRQQQLSTPVLFNFLTYTTSSPMGIFSYAET